MPSTYEYLELLRLDAVLYAFGPTTGAQAVQLTGDGFQDGATVDFGGVAATDVVVENQQTIFCTTPAHAAGFVDVTVTNPDASSDTLEDGYEYQATEADFSVVALERVRYNSIRIVESLGQPRQCSLRASVEPDATKDVQIAVYGRSIFTGTPTEIELSYEGRPTQLLWTADFVDYVAKLNYRRPYGVFDDESISDIVSTLFEGYAPAFVLHVEAGLPTTTIEFDGTEDFASCLNELAARVTASTGSGFTATARWFVDGLEVWFFVTYTGPNAPADLTDDNPDLILDDDTPIRLTLDYSQIRNRVTVRGIMDVQVQRDDVDSQELYGVREIVIEDTTLDGETELEVQAQLAKRAEIELARFAWPIPALSYPTRDINSRPGLSVTVNLTSPPIVGTFMIQTITMDQVNAATGVRYDPTDPPTVIHIKPRILVTAAPVRFDFMDFMRSTVLGVNTPPPNLTGSVDNDDLAGCIDSDKFADSGVEPGVYGGGPGSP